MGRAGDPDARNTAVSECSPRRLSLHHSLALRLSFRVTPRCTLYLGTESRGLARWLRRDGRGRSGRADSPWQPGRIRLAAYPVEWSGDEKAGIATKMGPRPHSKWCG